MCDLLHTCWQVEEELAAIGVPAATIDNILAAMQVRLGRAGNAAAVLSA